MGVRSNVRIIVEAASAEVQQTRVGRGWKKRGNQRMPEEKCCQRGSSEGDEICFQW